MNIRHALHRGALLAFALALIVGHAHAGDPPNYRITRLDTLGGASSAAFSVNDRGWVAGRSDQPDGRRVAALWRNGQLTPLGTLGGPNSAVRWPVKNVVGIVSGIAQTNEDDPYDEAWSCSAFFPAATGSGVRCLGFRWKDGRMEALPTLGGTHGFAAGTNNFGHTVGWAETATLDPDNCVPPQRLQFRPVLWTASGRARELPLPAGDSSGAATAINDRGQVVGISGICDQAIGRFTARRAVLWEHGRVVDLGGIGGVAWNTPNAINLRGDVVGFSNYRAEDGGNFNPHAFLKLRGRPMQDLDTLPGDTISEAWGINEWRTVVGRSIGPAGSRAFVWRDGAMHDLQPLATKGDALQLIAAYDIDNFGRITGQAFDPATGTFVGYLASPIAGD